MAVLTASIIERAKMMPEILVSDETYCICDYDIPAEPKAQRMRFYRGLWRILESHGIPTGERSTQSVWISGSQTVASEIHDLASRYGTSNLYEAKRTASSIPPERTLVVLA
jgi:hypothetical protein